MRFVYKSVGSAVLLSILLAGCGHSGEKPDGSGAGSTPGSGAVSQPPAASDSAGTDDTARPVQPYPTGKTHANPRGLPAGLKHVDTADPEAVAKGFAALTWAQDGRIDTSPWNAQKRSSRLATAQYAATLQEPAEAAPGAAWNAIEAKKAYTAVKVSVIPTDDAPPATDKAQVFTVEVTVTTVGVKAAAQHLVMFIRVTRVSAAEPWQVASSSVSDS